jgi:HD superfamily phosphohydrolase
MLTFDNIHGYIEVDDVAKSIIDTPHFQRLRRIKQVGLLSLVFHSANHSRFEHSVGTYYLAKKFITNLALHQPELKITPGIIKVVSLAGLCHDLGHLMFSHLFDDLFLPKLDHYKELGENVIHEIRSIKILQDMIKKYDIDITPGELKVISGLIEPDFNNYEEWDEEFKVGKWIFEIISNPRNGIDVDKFDYINRDNLYIGTKLDMDYSRLILQARVMNDQICYPYQCNNDIYQLFFSRYRLHKLAYNHKTVKALDLIMIDILYKLEKEYKISNYINDIDKMIKLTDEFVNFITTEKTEKLLHDIQTRNIPKLAFEKTSKEPIEIPEEVFKNFNFKYYELRRQVGYANGRKNPLSNVSFYSTKSMKIIPNITIGDYSHIVTECHKEYLYRIYVRDEKNKDKVIHTLL